MALEDGKRARLVRDVEERSTERSEMQDVCRHFLEFLLTHGVPVPAEQRAELIEAFVDERWPPANDP